MVSNIAKAEKSIAIKVDQTKKLDNNPLLYSPIILGLPAIFAITKIKGTAAIPLKTAVNTSAFIGSMPIKFIKSPINVATIIIP